MKKRLVSLLLTVVLLMSTAAAYTAEEVRTADAMNELGLFLGTNNGYELDNNLTRAQGVTLLVRMIGKEQAAGAQGYALPFTDVPGWAGIYIGYAYTNGITNGVSATRFDADGLMTDYMFLTLTLRALGYSDSGENAVFTWNKPYILAKQIGLIDTAAADQNFTRGDAVSVFWNALNARLADGSMTLAESLIAQEVFTAEQLDEAKNIQANGRKTNAGIPLVPGTGAPAVKPEAGSDPEGTEKPGDSATAPQPEKRPEDYTYEEYLAMTGEEQQAFFNSFASPEAFFAWMTAAKAAYDAAQEKIEIGDGGTIDLGDLVGGNG